jgi:hypothetical protein
MKKTEAIKKIREAETAIEVKRLEKLREIEAEMDLENRESNRNRARSITVGTAFGGTTELMMRSDGGRHIWCTLQPVEVVELIHQLSSNVGCNVALKPRNDFASWRDWRVSDAEKKHLNGHVPFVNDMAVFQQLGASGYNDEEAKKIMDILANFKGYANENDDAKILMQDTKAHGAPNLMFGAEDGLLHNKVVLHDNEVVYMAGGNGGRSDLIGAKDLTATTPTSVRKTKRDSPPTK